jgi:hypothetical protein
VVECQGEHERAGRPGTGQNFTCLGGFVMEVEIVVDYRIFVLPKKFDDG